MFTKIKGEDIVVLLVYVNGILITGSSEAMIKKLKYMLQQKFKVKSLRQLKFFLGIEVERLDRGIVIS